MAPRNVFLRSDRNGPLLFIHGGVREDLNDDSDFSLRCGFLIYLSFSGPFAAGKVLGDAYDPSLPSRMAASFCPFASSYADRISLEPLHGLDHGGKVQTPASLWLD